MNRRKIEQRKRSLPGIPSERTHLNSFLSLYHKLDLKIFDDDRLYEVAIKIS